MSKRRLVKELLSNYNNVPKINLRRLQTLVLNKFWNLNLDGANTNIYHEVITLTSTCHHYDFPLGKSLVNSNKSQGDFNAKFKLSRKEYSTMQMVDSIL